MNIQQLRAQIAALQYATMDENRKFRSAYDKGKFDALTAVNALLDSLQEEPISQELEQAAKAAIEYCGGNKGSDARVRAGFITGVKWDKEQMMKGAINAEVTYVLSVPCITLPLPLGVRVGDKVKVIILKDK